MTTTRRAFILDSMAIGGLALTSSACSSTSMHKPEILRVHIFVVPDEVFGGSKGAGPLTDVELTAAEPHVRQNARRLNLDATSIIVMRGQPANFHRDKLIRHNPAGARETVLKVWTESDVIEWQSDRPFAIVTIEKAEPPAPSVASAPKNPFYGDIPFNAASSDSTYKYQTPKLRASANGQQYKISLRIDGRLVDPDIICGSPPESA